jgi:hypothetical protein
LNKLRNLHLYLGCIFAPMLLFFAVSGIWQMLGLSRKGGLLAWLSTIHTSAQWKNGESLTSGPMMFFVLMMTLAFILTVILGVVMALKHTRSKWAVIGCLIFGVVFPLILALLRFARMI